jgi:subtilisin family serine protease
MQQSLSRYNLKKNLVALVICLLMLVVVTPKAPSAASENPTRQASASLSQDPAPTPEFVPNEILVRFKPQTTVTRAASGRTTTNLNSVNALMDHYGVTSAERVFKDARPPASGARIQIDGQSQSSADLTHIYRLRLADQSDVLVAIAAFKADPNVEYAEPNYMAHMAFVPNDPRYSAQWGLTQISAPSAWNVTHGSPAIVIAIVDTGLDLNHPDLISKLWVNPGEIPSNSLDDDNDGFVDDVNGWNFVENNLTPRIISATEVMSPALLPLQLTMGSGSRACPNCRIMSVRTMNDSGVRTYSNIAAGITYAAQTGARVINLSLGGTTYSQVLHDAVANASIVSVIIAAAGNNNDQTLFYPAAYDDFVVAVGATDANDQKATFSTYGSWVDLMAPGVSIWRTFYDDTYAAPSGPNGLAQRATQLLIPDVDGP